LAPKVLKVLKFDSPSGAEGGGIALMGDEYKDRVTGFPAPQVILSLRKGTPLYGYALCRAKEQKIYKAKHL
jgi:hypothetical protein